MPIRYAEYLELEQLLALQNPRSDPPEHDETLFIVIHQAYELWFKQLLHELDRIKRLFSANELFGAVDALKRVRMILKMAVSMVDILETMTPISFASFRDRLETASGFQSRQFREVEFVLGYKRPEMLEFHAGDAAALEQLRGRLEQPSLVDHFYDLLELRGARIPAEVRRKPSGAPNAPHIDVQGEILRLYRELPELALLFEAMTDIDEGLQEWRYRHVKAVERTIGNKPGTGGSSGVEFLKRSLFRPVFPDLWAIRTRF